MSEQNQAPMHKPIISQLAQNMIGSEIIKLAGEVREKMAAGEHIYNLTIGDFDPAIFPIPAHLSKCIVDAYLNNETNYPEPNGMLPLRKAIAGYLKHFGGLDYPAADILVSGGARPLIYATFLALVDPGEKVLFPVPSWNNNHYTFLSHAQQVMLETKPENNFMPTPEELEPLLGDITLLTLCSPLNPTGTVFSKENLSRICDLVVNENKRRGPGAKPLYVMFDQIYWALTFGNVKHFDPVTLNPEMRHYTIFIDGMSKAFAATGVRVGWSFGPSLIIEKMKAILSHVGAWAPRAEQIGAAHYLNQPQFVDEDIQTIRKSLDSRLVAFHKGFQALKSKGFKIDSLEPQGAIYLTVKFGLHKLKTADGIMLHTTRDITHYLLNKAKLAIVPFYAFGSDDESEWYRLSVGTCKVEEIPDILRFLEQALAPLH